MNKLTHADLDAIEARAKAATAGSWFTDDEDGFDGVPVYSETKGTDWVPIANVPVDYDDRKEREANAEHIVGMNPPMTLALVALARKGLGL